MPTPVPFLIICAYRAGYSMYKHDSYFSFRSYDVNETSISQRMAEDLEDGMYLIHCGTFGTHEFGFTLHGTGIDCADDSIMEHIKTGVMYSYHPEVGVSIIHNR